MEPIIINTQLSFETYYKVALYVMWKRFWWAISIFFIAVLICLFPPLLFNGDNSTTVLIGMVGIFYAMLLPLGVYIGARKNYKKIKAMSEPKVYEFYENNVKWIGKIASSTVDWSYFEKVFGRKNDLLILCANSRNFIVLPYADFALSTDMEKLKSLIKTKGIKNNFKD